MNAEAQNLGPIEPVASTEAVDSTEATEAVAAAQPADPAGSAETAQQGTARQPTIQQEAADEAPRAEQQPAGPTGTPWPGADPRERAFAQDRGPRAAPPYRGTVPDPRLAALRRRPRPRTGPIVWGALILVFCAYVAAHRASNGAVDTTTWIITTVIGLGVLLLAVGITVLIRGPRDRR